MSAEKAAHFTSTFEAKPSIFEVVAQNSLNSTLHPALQKVAQFLATSSPKYFNWFYEYYDETFLVLNGVLQYHYLKNYGASFSEYFYGLRRTPVSANQITERHKKLSLILLVVLPYLRRKLEGKIDFYRLEKAEGSFRNDISSRIKNLLIHCQTVFAVGWGSWILVNYLRYMGDQIESQLPELGILNLKLVYAIEPQDSQGYWTSLIKGQMSFQEIRKGLFQNLVYSSLEIGAFLTQFLQAWNSERSNYNVGALPTPEAPSKFLSEEYKGKCPICLFNWRIPTVLPVSGYIFCFACILRHLRENERCPVTNLPARPSDIIRLYDTD